jgi:TonB family protein
MRLGLLLALFLCAAVSSKCLNAQTTAKPQAPVAGMSALALKPASKLPHALVHPGDRFYPEALAKNGVQGTTTLGIRLSKEGAITAARIIVGSQSSDLDKNALDYARDTGWRLPDNGLKYYEGVYSLTIVFLKDTVLNINTKTCADFNTDLRYFRSIKPNESTNNLGAFQLLANIFTVQLMKNQGADGTLKFVKSVNAINSESIRACAKKPDGLLVKAYAKATRAHGIKF